MGCFPSKQQDAEDVAPSEEEKAAVSAATQVGPEQEKAAAERTKRSRKRAYLALIEPRNAHREVSIPQWPNPAERSLDLCLPVAIDYVEPRGINIGHTGPVGWDVFKNTKDRWKFISMFFAPIATHYHMHGPFCLRSRQNLLSWFYLQTAFIRSAQTALTFSSHEFISTMRLRTAPP